MHDGTTYKDATSQRVIQILETARRTRARICIRYGDVDTGRDWGDRRMCGTVGRSMGSIAIPLLIPTSRSSGGEGIFDDAIVKITQVGGLDLYTHPRYHYPVELMSPAEVKAQARAAARAAASQARMEAYRAQREARYRARLARKQRATRREATRASRVQKPLL